MTASTVDPAYAADLSDIPDEIMDRIGPRSLADATLFIDQLREAGCEPARPRIDTPRSQTIVDLVSGQYGWSRTRSLRALLAMDAIIDARDGGPDREMLEHIDATLALVGPLAPGEGGVSCAMRMPMARLERMVDDGIMTVVTKH